MHGASLATDKEGRMEKRKGTFLTHFPTTITEDVGDGDEKSTKWVNFKANKAVLGHR